MATPEQIQLGRQKLQQLRQTTKGTQSLVSTPSPQITPKPITTPTTPPVVSDRLSIGRQKLEEIRSGKIPTTTPTRPKLLTPTEIGEQREPIRPRVGQLLGKDIRERGAEIGRTFEESASGKISPVEGAIRIVGQTAAGVGDIAFRGLQTIARGISTLIPDVIEDPIKEKLTTLGENFLKSKTGQSALKAIEGGIKNYGEFRDKNPRIAKTIEGVVNIAELFPIGKGAGLTARGTRRVAGRGAEVLETGLRRQATKETLDIITPITKTLSKAERQIALESGRGTQRGILGRFKLTPGVEEERIANVVKGIVKKKNKPHENIFALNTNIRIKSNNLDSKLKGIDFEFNGKQIDDALENTKLESRVIFGSDAGLQNTYDAVIDEAKREIAKKPRTLENILQARRNLDDKFKKKFPGIFDKRNTDVVRSNAVMDVRESLNNFVAINAPERIIGVNVRKELFDITDMFKARKNISRNVISDLDTNIIQRAVNKLGGLRGTVALAGGLSVGAITGLLASPAFLISVALGVVTFKVGNRILKSQTIRRALIKLLDLVSDRKINLAGDEIKAINDVILSLPGPSFIPVKPKLDTSGIIREVRPGQRIIQRERLALPFPEKGIIKSGADITLPKKTLSTLERIERRRATPPSFPRKLFLPKPSGKATGLPIILPKESISTLEKRQIKRLSK